MHIKICSPGDWNLGVKNAELIKFSRKGLIGDDLNEFIKRAGHVFEKDLHNIKIAKDEIPLHVIALGATEAYGLNRNGDGFTADTCSKMHDTFVKNARWYRNHKNKDPDISYGVIKASAFNEAMQRIELIVALNAEKSAASRNGGFVADEELEKIAKGDDIPVSMACKVAYDVCTSCGNKARHRSEYCDEDSCVGPRGEKRGGCKNNLTKVADDGHQNGVDNPNADWFDMSKVWFPADRTAYGHPASYMSKAASGHVMGGAELAESFGLFGGGPLGIGRGADPWGEKTASHYRLVEALAEAEHEWLSPTDWHKQAGRILSSQYALDTSRLALKQNQADCLAAMAEQKVAMTPADFVRWHTGQGNEKLAEEVSARLPGIYGRFLADEDLHALLRSNPYIPAETASESARDWLDKQAVSKQPLSTAGLLSGTYMAEIRGVVHPVIKKASSIALPESSYAERLATSYALYKVAFLAAVPAGPDAELTRNLAVAQNYVS